MGIYTGIQNQRDNRKREQILEDRKKAYQMAISQGVGVPATPPISPSGERIEILAGDGIAVTKHPSGNRYTIATDGTSAAMGIISVKDYGALGDGATDDTVAIQNAIAASTYGSVIYFPPGEYRTNAPLVIPPQRTIEGSHAKRVYNSGTLVQQSKIKIRSTFVGTACINFQDKEIAGYSEDNSGIRIKHLAIDGSAASGTIDGIRADGYVHDVQLENVHVYAFPRNGISTAAYTREDTSSVHPYSWTITNSIVQACGNIGLSFNGTTDTTLVSVQAIGNDVYGFFLAGMNNSSMIACRAEWNESHGYMVTGSYGTGAGAGSLTISGCMSDRNNLNGIYINSTGSGHIVVSGCTFRRDGRNGLSGGGGYAGVFVDSAATPVILSGLSVYPGQNDDGTGTMSPAVGVHAEGSTFVSISSGYVHAYVTAINDGGTNTVFARGINVGTATGSTTSPTRDTTLPAEVVGSISLPAGDAVYLGDSATDGSWRLIRSGNNLIMERRESGSWVTKSTVTP